MSKLSWDPVEHYKDVEVAERYDRERFSRFSGRVFNRLEKLNIRRAFQDLPSGSTVVDIPCGTGRLSEVLVDMGLRVVGVDISPAMLEVARGKLADREDRFETVVWDARRLPELGRRFDAALCARVLMHFPLEEQIEFLRGVVSATDRRVVFTQSYSTGYQRLRRDAKRWLGQPEPAGYPITESELRILLREAGLKEQRRHRVLPAISESVAVVAGVEGGALVAESS